MTTTTITVRPNTDLDSIVFFRRKILDDGAILETAVGLLSSGDALDLVLGITTLVLRPSVDTDFVLGPFSLVATRSECTVDVMGVSNTGPRVETLEHTLGILGRALQDTMGAPLADIVRAHMQKAS